MSLGFLTVPIVDIAIAYIYWFIVWGRDEGFDPWDAATSLATAVAMAAIIVTFVGVIPAVLWLIRRGPVTLKQLLISGAALGTIPSLIMTVLMTSACVFGNPGDQGQVRIAIAMLAMGSVLGVITATAFWFIALRGSAFDLQTQ